MSKLPSPRSDQQKDRTTPFQAVFSAETTDRSRRSRFLAWSLAIAVHFSLWLSAGHSQPSLETWSAHVAVLVHQDLANHAPTDLEPLVVPKQPPAAPARELPKPDDQATKIPPPKQLKQPRPRVTKVAKAKAASVIATKKTAEQLDLTANTFVSGKATSYVGGSTTTTGTNTVAVAEHESDPNTRSTGNGGARSKAQAVRLFANQWHCPWPQKAIDRDIYEQFVELRVVVRANGKVESAELVHDPGHGFGKAAIACARRTRFTPARDASGRAIRAASPAIKVRFVR